MAVCFGFLQPTELPERSTFLKPRRAQTRENGPLQPHKTFLKSYPKRMPPRSWLLRHHPQSLSWLLRHHPQSLSGKQDQTQYATQGRSRAKRHNESFTARSKVCRVVACKNSKQLAKLTADHLVMLSRSFRKFRGPLRPQPMIRSFDSSAETYLQYQERDLLAPGGQIVQDLPRFFIQIEPRGAACFCLLCIRCTSVSSATR